MAFQPGYDRTEASDLIALLAYLEGGATPPLVLPQPPDDWQIVFDSPVIGDFDNKWQLARKTPAPGSSDQGTPYAVLIRGTVEAAGSIVDDLLAVTVPASGTLFGYRYQFAEEPSAGKQPGVHLGFGLAALILLFDPDNGILATLKSFHAREPIREVFIAGHSQGAAIATLVGSFLHYHPQEPFSGFQRKVYAYAQPKPGNDLYAADFNAIYGNGGMGITVNNSEDWVPQVPLTLQHLADLDTPNPISVALPRSPFQELEHILLKPLGLAVAGVREAAKLSHHQRQSKRRETLRSILQRQTLEPKTGDEDRLPEVMATLNFSGCGRIMSLIGVPGANPDDPKDFFWQHHASMYYALMNGLTIPGAG